MSALPSPPNDYSQRDQAALRQVLQTALADITRAQAAIRVLQASGGGGGGSPIASSTVTGTVKTFTDTADPVVYRKSDVDTLLGSYATAAALSSEAATRSSADATLTTAVAAAITSLTSDVTASGGGAAVATIAANAVTNAKLATMATHTIKANITGSTAVPTDVTLSALLDALLSSTQGDLAYRNATVWTTLPAGTAGYLLQTGGAGANPSYVIAPTYATTAVRGLVKVNTNDGSNDPIVYRKSEVDALLSGYSPTGTGSVKMIPSGAGVVVGKTQQLWARAFSDQGVELFGQSLSWATSDATKATVSGGLVTGVAAGSATITVTCNGHTATCAVTVIADPTELWYLNARDGLASWTTVAGTPASYYYDVNGKIQTTSSNAIRYQHHWGGRRGVCVEPAYDNGITRSDDISHADWTKTSCTVSGTILAPDGASNSNGVVPSVGRVTLADGTGHVSINCTSTASVGHGGIWMVSRGSKKWFYFGYKDRSGGFQTAWVNLDSGAVADLTGLFVYAERFGNGHWLIEWVKTATDTSGAGQAKIFAGFTDYRDTAGVDGLGGGIGHNCTSDGVAVAGYIAHAMSNKTRLPGTYLPTTSATVSRSRDDVLWPWAKTPGNLCYYYRGLEKGAFNSAKDGTMCYWCVDGTTSQGSHQHYMYLTTAQKLTSFDNTANNSNPGCNSPGTITPLLTIGEEIELMSNTNAGGTAKDYIYWMHTPTAAGSVPSTEDNTSGGAPASIGGSYSAAFGAGTVYIFLGQLSGGTLTAPTLLTEFKIWRNADKSNFYDARRSGSPYEPVYAITFTPTGNAGQPCPCIEIGEAQNFGIAIVDRYGTVLNWSSGAGNPLYFERQVSFGSSNTAVATIDSYGTVTGVAAGITTISAYCEGVYTRQFVRVRAVA